jgi:hypothetical protein
MFVALGRREHQLRIPPIIDRPDRSIVIAWIGVVIGVGAKRSSCTA